MKLAEDWASRDLAASSVSVVEKEGVVEVTALVSCFSGGF